MRQGGIPVMGESRAEPMQNYGAKCRLENKPSEAVKPQCCNSALRLLAGLSQTSCSHKAVFVQERRGLARWSMPASMRVKRACGACLSPQHRGGGSCTPGFLRSSSATLDPGCLRLAWASWDPTSKEEKNILGEGCRDRPPPGDGPSRSRG